jgi:hypothetical protein
MVRPRTLSPEPTRARQDSRQLGYRPRVRLKDPGLRASTVDFTTTLAAVMAGGGEHMNTVLCEVPVYLSN